MRCCAEKSVTMPQFAAMPKHARLHATAGCKPSARTDATQRHRLTLLAILATEHAALAKAVADRRDKAAFTQLFDYYAPRIKALLVQMKLDPASAEEVTQDVMIVLWRKADMFDPARASLATWLYRVARNSRIDRLRRSRVDYFDPLEPGFDREDENQIGADARMDASQREERLQEALLSLPGEQVALIRLAFFDGLSHSEIAVQAGVPLGTVKSRIRLAFGRLRRALAERGIIESGTGSE